MRTGQTRTAATADAGDAEGPTPDEPTPGEPTPGGPLVLERYRLTRRLGTGAFGTVWMARDEHLRRYVAVKILARERIVSGRFEREAQAAARLSHPGIVTLYEAAVDEEGAYLVSELIRGATLQRLLAEGRLSDRAILTVGIALCDALAYAHGEGVVHRDVKPANVLVPSRPAGEGSAAKLTDFGVARVLDGEVLTATGDVVGTVAYMAPEQAEGLPVGPPADLYSLAVVLYEALTAVNPVASALRRTGGASRRLGATLPPLRRQRRDLPPVLGHALDTALRPRPSERGTLLHLRGGLQAALPVVGDEPGVVAPPALPTLRRARAERAPADPEPRARTGGREEVPERALAAAGAAATAAWGVTHLLSAPSAVPPAGAALTAGVLTLLLPRVGWLAVAAVLSGIASTQGHGGVALIALAAMLIPAALLLLTRPTMWPLTAGAPALALVGLALPVTLPGLAGAWPALAGRAGGIWRRAALAAGGWMTLALTAALAGRTLYQPLPAQAAARAWIGSPSAALHALVLILTSPALLAGALAWTAAAVLLPWAQDRGGLIPIVAWAGALTMSLALARAGPSAGPLVLGGLAAGLLAAAPGLVRPRRNARSHGIAESFP